MTDKTTPSTGELWMLTGIGASLLAGHMVMDQVARFNRSGAPARMLMAGVAPFAIAGWMMSQMASTRILPETTPPAPAPNRKRVDQATDAEVVVAPRPRLVATPEAPMTPVSAEEVVDVVAALPEHGPAPQVEAEPEAEVGAEAPEASLAARPMALSEQRMDAPDDLTRIKGVGPKLAEQLNDLGYYHFDQVAAWSAEELEAVDALLDSFGGRATRDDWIGQARALCAGAMH